VTALHSPRTGRPATCTRTERKKTVNNTNHKYLTATIHLPAARNFTVGDNASRNFDAGEHPGQ
jgi:hypothetical protein